MKHGSNNPHPAPISAEELARYHRGELDPVAANRVERALLADPLLRDAAEGWALPGADDGLATLKAARPHTGVSGWWAVPVLLMIGAAAVWWATGTEAEQVEPRAVERTAELRDSVVRTLAATVVHDTALAFDQPVVERSAEAFVQEPAAAPVDRTRLTEALPIHPAPALERGAIKADPRKDQVTEAHRLVFLHGLKLVHPEELDMRGATTILARGVSADRNRGGARQDLLPPDAVPRRPVNYLAWMDGALAGLVSGKPRRTVEDLATVLDQYPADVNAQFYMGLALFEQGEHARARDWFRKAAVHPLRVFQPEAAWYTALCTYRVDGADAARPLVQRIVDQGGFYAERAAAFPW